MKRPPAPAGKRVPSNPIPWCVVHTETGAVMSQHTTRQEAERFAAFDRRYRQRSHVAKLEGRPCR